ncbi:hypothetical protein BX070DRAFT_237343 [Coemansia spiralis]|nr:hypothetical protein BX070DRAFT_237343 [Coemansia spiralis]
MSYIPRSPTISAAMSRNEQQTVGRADELRSVPSSHSSNSGVPSFLFTRPQPTTVGGPGPIRLPPSTRVSVVKVISEKSQLPALPPIPNIGTGSANVVSSGGAVPEFASHRRAVSAGNELKALDSSTAHDADTLGFGTTQAADLDSGPHTYSSGFSKDTKSKTRLGLSSFKFPWVSSKSNRRASTANPTSAAAAYQNTGYDGPRWTAEEVNALALASIHYWKDGSLVDYRALSADMCRPADEIRDMLEYMLQGYVRFGGNAFWIGENPEFLTKWAAKEFPKSPVLNPSYVTISAKAPTNNSRLDTCLSALKCRPPNASYSSDYIVDNLKGTSSGQNIVADFRESMRIHDVAGALSLGQKKQAAGKSAMQDEKAAVPNLAPLSNPSLHTEPTNATAERNDSTHGLDSTTATQQKNSNRHTHGRSKSNANRQVLYTKQTAAFDAVDNDNSSKQGRIAAGDGPIFTGGLRNKQTLNTLSRETRSRRIRNGSLKTDSEAGEAIKKDTQTNNTLEPPASFTFTLSPNTTAAAAISETTPVLKAVEPVELLPKPANNIGARQRAHTVAHTQNSANASVAQRLSQDSGNVDSSKAIIPIVAMLDDMELSPVQSNVIAISQTDSQLDAQFEDIGSEARQKARRFVDRFISDFPVDFQQRVKALQMGKDGLCITVDNFPDFEYTNDAFMKAIETIYRYVGGSVIYTCNMFFHVQLLHAVRIDRIPVTEDNWLRVNEFATKVFNKRIEDARFIVLEEYSKDRSSDGMATSSQDGINGSTAVNVRRPLFSPSGSKYDSIVGSEGNEHLLPFERAFYMDKLARRYVQFFLENSSDEIMKRARSGGSYRPMPVALQVDEEQMLPFDIEIRNLLIAFIWEDLPQSTLESKEITLLRALELLNGELADRCGFRLNSLRELLDQTKNEDGPAEDDKVITDIAALKDLPAIRLAQALGKSFARQYFDEGKARYLEAMLHDHPFRPIGREELKEWISRGSSPFGEDVDYQLNSRLHKYLRQLNVRPGSKQWLQASASATLSMLRRTCNAIIDKSYLGHIDIDGCQQRFDEIIQDTRIRSDGSATSNVFAYLRPTDAGKLRLSAFGKAPAWVSLLTESRSVGELPIAKASTKTTKRSAENIAATTTVPTADKIQAANRKIENAQAVVIDLRRDGQKRLSTVNGVKEPTSAVSASHAQEADAATINSKLLATAPIQHHPMVNGVQGPPSSFSADMDYQPDYPAAYAQMHQNKNNISLPNQLHQYTVPMPANGYHMSQPVSMAHVYSPYGPMDHLHQPMPFVYSPVTAAAYSHAPVNGNANMDMVMRKFEEMQEMIRQIQAHNQNQESERHR